MTKRAMAQPRSAYRHFTRLDTRWMDNDVYGHINNVVYYSYFDTAVNRYLIDAQALDINNGDVIGLVVQTQCHYFEPLAFPQALEAGLSVSHVGRTSVHWDVGLFAAEAQATAAAGHFVHVYVDRATRRPVALPPALLVALQSIRSLRSAT